MIRPRAILDNHTTIGEPRAFVIGYSKDPAFVFMIKQFAKERNMPFTAWDYGRSGTLFLLNSHPDCAQSEDYMVIHLGFSRSETREMLTSQDLVSSDYTGMHGINHKKIHGNPTLVCIDQSKPTFWVYQGLASISQLYYWQTQDTFLGSDSLRFAAGLSRQLELNPNAIPLHLMYRIIPGRLTHFAQISKLTAGQIGEFRDGNWHVDQVDKIDELIPEKQLDRACRESVKEVERDLEQILGSYARFIERSGHNLALLLSGGVDSTLIGSLIRSHIPANQPFKSLSYRIHVPSFKNEERYCQHAVNLLRSNHNYYDVYPEDYPHLMERAIKVLAQPLDNEQDPCYLHLASTLSKGDTKYFFSGSGQDCLLGSGNTKRLSQLMFFGKYPWTRYPLRFFGQLLQNYFPNKAYGMLEVSQLLRYINDPLSPSHPVNAGGMMTDIIMVERWFEPSVIRASMEYNAEEFAKITSSTHLVERVHFNSVVHDVLDEEAALSQFFRLYGLELVDPYLDSDVIRLALRYSPKVRYFAYGKVKWIPKMILENRLGPQAVQPKKLSGGFNNELFLWMKSGILKEMVESIDRPGYINQRDFHEIKENPGWLTWNLLNLDLFQKKVLSMA